MTAGNAKKEKPGKIVSLAELANILGCTDPTVRSYIKSGMPVEGKGKAGKGYQLDTAKCIRWLVEQRTDGVELTGSSFDKNRARKMAADADKAEMDRDMMRGQLVEVGVAVSIVGDRLQTLRSRLLNLPSKMAVKLAAMMTREECLDYLDEQFDILLKELSGGK